MDVVLEHERALVRLATARLQEIDGVRVYGPPPTERSGVVSFTVADIHPHDLATILDQEGVCIRAGHHCAQPLMRRLGVSATARASFYVYNDERDVEALVGGVRKAKALFAEPSLTSGF
jgi:cysteine desulfurase/selenocysteine lyase